MGEREQQLRREQAVAKQGKANPPLVPNPDLGPVKPDLTPEVLDEAAQAVEDRGKLPEADGSEFVLPAAVKPKPARKPRASRGGAKK